MRTIVLVSANSEWRAVIELLKPLKLHSTPLGEYFDLQFPTKKRDPLKHDTGTRGDGTRYFHGGWGKISAAATTQYAIDRWHPDLLVNLGTCGGFQGRVARGAILLVTKTIVYDIIEQMSDPAEAVAHYSTEIDLSWLKAAFPPNVQRGLLLSADRDILARDIPGLVDKFGAVAADWESGAIAWVSQRNGVRCLILRGVTDLVGADGGEAYGNIELFHENTRSIMKELLVLLETLHLGQE